jgi:hypothetical protein
VALVHRLEESHLGVTGQVNVLSAVSNQLHKSTRHFDISQENNFGRRVCRRRASGHKYFCPCTSTNG